MSKTFISGFAPVNGLNMYYEIHGKGLPLVLIHGGGSTIETTFGHILPMLAQHYKVIAVELQAHGHTADRNTPESFTQDANDVAALLSYLNIENAFFIGFSNGGQTCLEIGIKHASIARKLVIISAFYKKEGMTPGIFDGMPNATIDNMPALLKSTYMAIPGNTHEGLMAMFNQDKNRMIQFKGWTDAEVESIKAPTLVISGDKDVATPQHTAEMASRISGASLCILPGNHGSFIGEICTIQEGSRIPALTVELIKEFLDKD